MTAFRALQNRLHMPTDLCINELPDDHRFNDIQYNESLFPLLFRKHFTPLCVYCQYQYSFDLDLAKEAAHMAFIKLWETRHTITSDLTVKAYLYKIVSNTCLDIIKHRNVKKKYEKHIQDNQDEMDFAYDFNASDTKALQEAIDKAVAALPEKMRIIFELSRYEGLKYAQIAQRLELSVNTVETQIGRALIKLRQKLSGFYIDLGVILLMHEIIFKSL